jgi:pyruvate dehydrogenase E2 component (dihydrolipoamide acetyltransferase)
MAEIIRMPRMSDTMEEGVIAKWLKKVGDTVKSGDSLAEVETDKATMELESYQDGTLLYLGVDEKQSVRVDGVLAIVGKKGENIDELIKNIKSETVNTEAPKSDKQKKEMPVKESFPDISKIKASVITMPRMSDTMTEGIISKWTKKVGDSVKSGDVLAEVQTDKATMELEAFDAGILLYVAVSEGSSVAVDGIIAVVGEKDADYQTLVKNFRMHHIQEVSIAAPDMPGKEAVKLPSSAVNASGAPKAVIPSKQVSASGDSNGSLKASPLAKKIAGDLGYDLAVIRGSGENGRIIKRDIDAYVNLPESEKTSAKKRLSPAKDLPVISGKESYEDVAVSPMRKTIARRLSESKNSAPHFYLTMEINMDRAVDARNSINENSEIKISYNDLIIVATAKALRLHPKVNSSWLGDKIRYNGHIHIGIAVAVEEGLIVPVIRFADQKSLEHIAVEARQLGEKARNKGLQPKDWEGNTFTISNLGMFGIEEFTAIINPPDACILAVGGIRQVPVVKNGQVVPGNTMKLTLSCDHRVVDGAMGAAFLNTLKDFLENPIMMFV